MLRNAVQNTHLQKVNKMQYTVGITTQPQSQSLAEIRHREEYKTEKFVHVMTLPHRVHFFISLCYFYLCLQTNLKLLCSYKLTGIALSVQGLAYGLDGPELETSQGQEILLFSKCPDRRWIPYSLILSGHLASFSGVQRKRRGFGCSPSCSEEIRNEWSYKSAPPARLNGVNRDSFTFTFYL